MTHPVSAWNIVESTLLPATADRWEILRLLPDDLTHRFIRFDHCCALVTARFKSSDLALSIAAFDRLQEKLQHVDKEYATLTVHLELYAGVAS